MEQVADNLGIAMHYARTDEHIPEAKHNNRMLQECIRDTYHKLQYKAMPKLMLQHLAMLVAEQLNMFPAKGAISTHTTAVHDSQGESIGF